MAFAALATFTGCGGAPPPPPPVPPDVVGSACPLPLVFAPDEPRPRQVRIENRTDRTVQVFLDRCFWHSRMADVPPAARRRARLSGELVAFDGSLWFHAYDGEGKVGTYPVELGPGPVLELVLEPGAEAADGIGPRWDPLPEGTERSAGTTLLADAERGFVALWGVGGGGVLTWSCRDDEGPWVSVTLGRKVRGSETPVVELELAGEWRDTGPWTVQESVTDVLVAPLDVGAELTESLLTEETMRLGVREGHSRSTVFAFEVGALARRLDTLRCRSG